MMESYLTVSCAGSAEFIEKRSRFIGHIAPAESEEAAAAFIADVRAQHRKANHNCYAYILRGSNIVRYSDDGEPQGTAGTPILEVIRREGIMDAAVVVTRYFGGIHLGAGGLFRAYGHGAKIALEAVGIAEMCRCVDFMLETPYSFYEQAQKLLLSHPIRILDTIFADDVTLCVRIKAGGLTKLEAELTELSAGRLGVVITGELFAGM